MIPAAFEYVRPATLEEALAILADDDGSSRPIAGGQSLLPLMKLRLARPTRLVDIGRFAELRGVRSLADGRLAIGALTTWSDLLAEPRVMAFGALRDAIPQIGDVAIRNRGTIGGSLAHADPAADIAAAVLALGAEVVVLSAAPGSAAPGSAATGSTATERTIRAAELFTGPFTTSLATGELISEIRLPAPREEVGSAYVAVSHPASGYPIAGAAVVVGRASRASGGRDTCSLALTGVWERPSRAPVIEAAVRSGAALEAAIRGVAGGQRVLSDPYADRDYRAAMAGVVAGRALRAAMERAAG